MSLFSNKYPYTDFHELNLDWIIQEVKKLELQLGDFVKINTIKYANPILWNITSQYEANTVVIDGSTGNAYISTHPVPVGVDISRTEYWTDIFNYEIRIRQINDALNAKIDTNVERIDNELNLLDEKISSETTTREEAINTETLERTEAVNTLTLSLDNEISERELLSQKVNIIELSKPINILTLGAKNDGSEDVSTIINEYTSQFPLYMPAGEYRIDTPINLVNSLYGAGNSNGYIESDTYSNSTWIISNINTLDNTKSVISLTDCNDLSIIGLNVKCKSSENGILFKMTHDSFIQCKNVSVFEVSSVGINITPTVVISKPVMFDNCCVFGKFGEKSTGMYFSNNSPDCRVTNTLIMGVQHGVDAFNNILYMSDCHIWTGQFNCPASWWEETTGFRIIGCTVYGSNIYVDSPLIGFYMLPSGEAHIDNLIMWYDTSMSQSSRTDASLIVGDGRLYLNNGRIYGDIRLRNIFRYDNIISNNVSIITDYNFKNDTYYPTFPLCRENPSYVLNNVTGGMLKYVEIACYRLAKGVSKLKITNNIGDTDIITLKYTNDGAFSAKKESLNGDAGYWYKISGNFVTIYTGAFDNKSFVQALYNDNTLIPINYDLIRRLDGSVYEREYLTSTAGLTTITAQV